MFGRAKHSHWQNTDLQVNRSIIHRSITKGRNRERGKEEKKQAKTRLRVSRGEQLSHSVHPIMISTISLCDLTSSVRVMQSKASTIYFNDD